MTASDASGGSGSTVLVHRGVSVRETPERTLELDVYRPRDVAGSTADSSSHSSTVVDSDPNDGRPDRPNRPIAVFVYGGGWTDGATGQFARYALDFAAAGWIAVECSYRLADEAAFPAQIVDVHAALDWLGEHAAAYGGDPERLALVGHSAGAHLAALASVTRDRPELTPDPSSRPDERGSVAAVAGLSGVYDFDLSAASRETFADLLADLGADSSLPEQRRVASPVTHVTAAAPPTLLLHGADDGVVPPEQSERYRDALAEADVPVDCETVPDADHVFLHSSGEFESTRARIASFFGDYV